MDSEKLISAMAFASKAHEGTYRKGTRIPYITHPMEAGALAMTLTNDMDVIVAAILHDVVEDTEYTLEQIQQSFGARVAELVAYETEDKMRHLPPETSWRMRKEQFIAHLSKAPVEAKMICLCDKVSNLRLTRMTYQQKGDSMWQVFHEKDPKEHAWYYENVLKQLGELKDTMAYQEYEMLYQEIFVR